MRIALYLYNVIFTSTQKILNSLQCITYQHLASELVSHSMYIED